MQKMTLQILLHRRHRSLFQPFLIFPGIHFFHLVFLLLGGNIILLIFLCSSFIAIEKQKVFCSNCTKPYYEKRIRIKKTWTKKCIAHVNLFHTLLLLFISSVCFSELWHTRVHHYMKLRTAGRGPLLKLTL